MVILRVLLNVIIDDYRFRWDEISFELDKVIKFYENYGINIFYFRRIREPFIGINLHFCEPNGSQAYLFQKKALITYNDWFKYRYQRLGLLLHELNHAIFKLPDHYEGSDYYIPTLEPCVMKDMNILTFCSSCLHHVENTIFVIILPLING